MKVVLVEDIADWQEIAKESMGQLGVEIANLATELEFYQAIPDLEMAPPALFVIDVMLPYTDPSREMPGIPEEVIKNGWQNAGIRCQLKLAQSAVLATIPVVFWTISSEEQLRKEFSGRLPSNCTYVSKDDDLSRLTYEVRRLLGI